MSDAFPDTQQRFAHRIKDGRVCHILLPTLNKFEKVSNSPTQRSELKTNPNLFRQNTYLQNKKHMLTCQRWDWLL